MSPRPARLLPASLGAALLLGAVGALSTGCQMLPDLPRAQGGELVLTGRTVLAKAATVLERDDQPTLALDFDRAYYTCEGTQATVFVLLQGDEAKPAAAAIVRVLWRPTAGSTPIDGHASNATLRVLRFGATQTEVWTGAGFVFLKDKPKNFYMTGQCWNADINLTDASNGAHDTLGPAQAEGDFTATYAPEKVAELVGLLQAKERQAFQRKRP